MRSCHRIAYPGVVTSVAVSSSHQLMGRLLSTVILRFVRRGLNMAALCALALLPSTSFADDVRNYYNSANQLVEAANLTTGRADILTYDANGNLTNISSILTSALTISGFTPGSGAVGSLVMISGTGFNATAASNTVKFNGTNATVSSASATQLAVTVPTGATTGPIVVTNSLGTVTSTSNFVVAPGSSGNISVAAVSPASLSYGNVLLGSTSVARSVTVTNNGTAPLNIATVVISGVSASDYVVSSNTCSSAIAIAANCVISMTFSPSVVGSRSAALQISSDASNGTQSVPLSGVGASVLVTVAPTTLAYAGQIVNTVSAAKLVTVTNNGVSSLTVGALTLSGANASDYAIASNGCSSAVAAGANCAISLTFNPMTTGSRTATLQIPSNASNGTQSVSLSGTGIASTASVTPASLTYANQLVNTTSAGQSVTVTNSGTSPLNVSSVTLAGANAADFVIASNGCSAAVANGGNCVISLTFKPTTAGSRTATLQIASDANNGLQSVPLNGTGIAAVASVAPTSLTYASQLINTISAAQSVTVTNSGTSPLTVSSVTLVGTNPGDYTISANGCSAALAVGSNCVIGVTFKPTLAGSRSATLQIASDASNGTQSVTLIGTGISAMASVAPAALSFANQLINTISAAQSVTVTNSGTSPLTVSGVTLTGTNATDFTVASNGCSTAVAVGANCVISVTFKPTVAGSRSGALQIASNASNGNQSIPLSGTGISPVASVAPTLLTFASQLINTTSTAQSVTVTNSGTSPLTVSGVALSGTNATDFIIASNGCSAAVAPGSNCVISVTFTPPVAGSRTATLQIPSNASNGTQSVSLSGTGISAVAAIAPTSLTYASQVLNTTSAAQSVIVTNSGTSSLTVGALSLSGTAANDFIIASNGCSTAVAVGANCTISLTFKPTATGSRTATLQVPSNASNGTQSVSLTGTGVSAVASVAPTSLTYASQIINTTSTAQSVTVTNSGTSSLSVGTLLLSGTNAGDYIIASNGCGIAVAVGANCVISLTFKPTAVGSRTATLQIPSNASNGTQSVTLTGTGVSAIASVAPTSLAYANLLINTTSASQSVTVTNSGTSSLTVSSVTLAGTNPGDYAISSNGCSTAVAVGANCVISVTFTPTVMGSRSGTLQIASNASNGTQSVALSGTGISAVASIAPASLTYTSQVLNTNSAAQSVTVTNSGTSSLTVGTLSLTGTNASDFIISSNGCSTAVAVGANCTISLTFKPTATGSRTATLQIPSNANNGTQSVSLTGTGVSAIASVAPTSLTYASQLFNTTSAAKTVTVTNTGTSSLTVTGVTLTGTNATDFAISSNGCSASVAIGANCVIAVTFTPPVAGSRTATLQVASNASNGTQSVPLTGTGISAVASVAPTSLGYANQLINTTSAAQSVTVTNTGTSSLTVTGVTLAGANPSDYTISNNGCSATVAVGANCIISVTFTPATVGSRTGILQIASNASNGTQSVPLTGTGIAPAVNVAPTSASFGNQLINTASAVQTITVTNTGTAALHLGAVSLSGTNATDYAFSNGCGPSVAAGTNCTISVTFTPPTTGDSSATLTIPSDATNGTQTVSLSGTGVAPAASAAPGTLTFGSQLVGSPSSSQSVVVSNTGTAPLNVSALSFVGANMNDYSVASNGCGSAVAPGQTCTVTVTLNPSAMGGRSATLNIASDAMNGTQTVSLSGTGIAPVAGITPATKDFGPVLVLLSSNTMYYTVTNSGTAPLNVGTISLAGTNPTDFVIMGGSTCSSAVLAPSQTCSVGLQFKPAHGGSRSATLQVPSDAFNGTVTAQATGTGLGL